jgi:hypothetical protein
MLWPSHHVTTGDVGRLLCAISTHTAGAVLRGGAHLYCTPRGWRSAFYLAPLQSQQRGELLQTIDYLSLCRAWQIPPSCRGILRGESWTNSSFSQSLYVPSCLLPYSMSFPEYSCYIAPIGQPPLCEWLLYFCRPSLSEALDSGFMTPFGGGCGGMCLFSATLIRLLFHRLPHLTGPPPDLLHFQHRQGDSP